MTQYKVKYETGPTAADCYSMIVNSNTQESAKRMVEKKYPTAYVTSIEEVTGNSMTQFTINAVNAQTARQATDKARSLDGDYKRLETTKILESVQAASNKGMDSVQTGSLDEVVKQRLRNLGFKVAWTDGFDQRGPGCDPGYTTISW